MKAIVLAAFFVMLGGVAQTPTHFEGHKAWVVTTSDK